MPTSRPLRALIRCLSLAVIAPLLALPAAVSTAQTAPSSPTVEQQQAPSAGPVRLRQNAARGLQQQPSTTFLPTPAQMQAPRPPREPDEFERFVSGLAGFTPAGRPVEIRRFGSDLIQAAEDQAGVEAEPMPLVPGDYLIKPGDEIVVSLWGSVDAELNATVDRSGRISLPRVGAVVVAGTRYAELTEVLRRRVAKVFKNFDISVSMGSLRGARVFVTGFAQRPGAYNLTSLSTVSQAVFKAGGPSAAGSFRQITLRRKGQPAQAFDLYDLIGKGDRGGDVVLQPDDVVHIGAVGTQVAMMGSVNLPAIFELKAGETVRELVQMAGGLSPVADGRRLTLERLDERDKLRVVELQLPESEKRTLVQGDVLRAISAVSASGSQLPQNKRVSVEGEVKRPGTYLLPPGSSLLDAVAAAGGLTASAYVYGTELQRESVRVGQQVNYDRALRDIETEFARAAASNRTATVEEATAQNARESATNRLMERLRALRPTGRVVLELAPNAAELPPLLLEDSDRLYVPARSTTVGVFGSVFSAGSYLYGERRALGDYLRLAGGPTRGADKNSVFVIRANGTVISELQSASWFSGGKLAGVPALPGDTVFVPEEINKTTFIQDAKDWTQVLFQFGLGVAAFKSLGN